MHDPILAAHHRRSPIGPDLYSEAELTALVAAFYARVRADPQLAPLFEPRIEDWDAHRAQLVAFWSALLRGTRRFEGVPVARHLQMPGLSEALFLRWLELFRETTRACGNEALRREADDAASRIAGHLWQRYQVHWNLPAAPADCG